MKILFHHRIASRDGQAVHMDEMIDALRGLGHEVFLVGPARGGQESEFGSDAGLIATLKRLLPRAIYEILEAAYSIPAFFRLYRAWRAHRPDVVYERYNLFMFAGLWLKYLTGVPLLLEVNGPIFEERSLHDGLSLQKFAAWAQGAVWRGVDYVLPVTQVLAGYVQRYRVPGNRIHVIPNGINPVRFTARQAGKDIRAKYALEGKLVLGFTGFIRSWNALDRVIELIARDGGRHNLHLLVVGDGPARPEITQLAQARGVGDRLTITGVVGRDDVADYVNAFDIALIPGVTEYASPLKLFEYLALGRAIVAPDMPNIREILTDGENAVLFATDSGKEDAFASAILRLCAAPTMCKQIASGAKTTIEAQGLTWPRNAMRVVEIVDTHRRQQL
ncbi:MAG: glycosyltransferase family 4 protein [Pseudomonadota bacterium]